MEKDNYYIDMHMHSIYSDGQYDINILLDKAIRSNIKTLSITDHDTLLGNINISDEYRYNKNLNIINGLRFKGNETEETVKQFINLK